MEVAQPHHLLFSPELVGSHTLCLVYTHEDGLWTDHRAKIVAHFSRSYFLNKLVSALQLLHRLTHLRITVVSDVRYSLCSIKTQSDEFMRAAWGSSFDFYGTAAACIPLLPALQCIFIESHGTLTITDSDRVVHGSEEYEDWHVLRGGPVAEPSTCRAHDAGEPALVELTDDVMEATIRREELVLSDDEQVLPDSRSDHN